MKSRYYLALMVLPALFAACTNDDFETVQNNSLVDSVLKNRAKGELILNASKAGEEDAQTRIVGTANGTAIDWLWESADDKIGGVVVDYKDDKRTDNIDLIATADDSYTITNYPFAPNINAPSASAEFSTPTTVVEGAYMFYNLYDGNNTGRGQIKAEIDRIQKVNAGEEAGLKQVGTTSNGGQNFFVSPIMDMAIADGEPIETPVTLTSAHSVLKFTFKADLEDKYWGNFTVNKVVIKGVKDDKFARTLTIDPQKIAYIQKGIRDAVVNGDTPYDDYFKNNGAIRTRDNNGNLVSDDQIKTALKLVTDAISLKDDNGDLKEIGTLSDKCNDLQFQLETPYVFNSKDDVMELMVVVPAGTYERENFGVALNEDDNNTEGLFELDVYTSEGIYKTYLNSYDEDDQMVEERTLERGKKYGMPEQTLIINGGYTNITLFDQNDEFVVETTEDWNYTIDYINAHYRDFGNNNAWKTPLVKIVGEEITVDADHYFPAFPVKYEGDAKLYLVGQNEYKFNPTCAILDNTNRPTLYVVDQKNASVVFDMDVKKDIKDFYGKAGVATESDEKGVQQTITDAIKLISDAQVVIKKGTEVQFEELDNRGTMTIEEDVKVEVDDSKSDKTQAILLADATNKGVMNIYGRLYSENNGLDNAATATINVKSFQNGINNKIRGIVALNTLVNKGVINIESGVQYKGTYGGKVDVKTLTNTFTTGTKGEINNNGELMVQTIHSNGTITVGKDPYALIQLKSGYVSDPLYGYGSVVLADATQYEIYNEYYSESSLIADDVEGTVETTLTSQEEYNEIVENHVQYSKVAPNLQTALAVLNMVSVEGVVLELAKFENASYYDEYSNINLYLGDNAGVNIKNVGGKITFASVNAYGKNVSLVSTSKGDAQDVLKAGTLNTSAKADMTIDKKVKVEVIYRNYTSNNYMMYLLGKLTNNGWIDTQDSNTDDANNISMYIGKEGSLYNKGKMSKTSDPKYDVEAYTSLKTIIGQLYDAEQGSNSYYRGHFGINVPRVDLIESAISNIESKSWNSNQKWNEYTQNQAGNYIQKDEIIRLLTQGTLVHVQNFQAIAVAHDTQSTTWSWVLYLGGSAGNDVVTEEEFAVWQSLAKADPELILTDGTMKNNPYLAKTWVYVYQNNGIIDLRDGKAWGEIAEGMNKGAKYGDFENDK